MARTREFYCYDYGGDFGLSGLAGVLYARAALRLDGPVVLALARATAEDDDFQIGRDVRLLLDSGLPEGTLHTVWSAAVRRCFDPVEEGADTRAWLREVAKVCPPRLPERDPYEEQALDASRPRVREEELRTSVAAEIESAAAGLVRGVAVPGIVPALLRVVREADADLGFRLFLRVLKAYAVPVGKEQYDRFVALGELLAFPWAAVSAELRVRWPALDPGWRDFGGLRFGVPWLAVVLADGLYGGTALDQAREIVCHEVGEVPGVHAAVLLADVRRLLDSDLPDVSVGAVWWTAAHRWGLGDGPGPGEFDTDVRGWLEQVAAACEEHLAKIDPGYVPYVPPARAEATEAVLREVRRIGPTLPRHVPEAAAAALEDVVRCVDPDLGFRFLVGIVRVYSVPVDAGRRRCYRAIAVSLGFPEGYVDEVLPDGDPWA
ncbi:hypothetical protein ABZ990_26215 [Streptomyces sp. NPDC046203]|uniref:hypothetical protein n=1 Tax=Streptomyces sp. NPDC046203 TaxID=3154602 RepID=UPI00340645F8